MKQRSWIETPVGSGHDRAGFDCGDHDINDYFRRYARQNHKTGGAKAFVATPEDEPARVLGFYTLSPASVAFSRAPAPVTRRLGRYEVPTFRLGRLAVSLAAQGRGLGGQLLVAAGRRCLAVAEEVGGVALLIDAKSDRAAEWYEGFGALRLVDAPLSLLLPLATIAQAIDDAE